MANNSDVIIPADIKNPDRKTSRADGLTFVIERAAQRIGDDRIKTAGVHAQHELRKLEDEIDAAARRGLRGADLREAAREARAVREENLRAIVDGIAGAARDQQLPQLRAELAKIPAGDVNAEREIRNWLMTLDQRAREEHLRATDDAQQLAAAINAPFPIVGDSARKYLTESYNRTHRAALVEQADAVDSFVGTVESISDMVLRQFDQIAPRPF